MSSFSDVKMLLKTFKENNKFTVVAFVYANFAKVSSWKTAFVKLFIIVSVSF
jgi:hypothetical protein